MPFVFVIGMNMTILQEFGEEVEGDREKGHWKKRMRFKLMYDFPDMGQGVHPMRI